MTRRIILILLGAFIILALMFALWFWLFGKQTEVEEDLAGFGAAGDRGAQVDTGAGTSGNVQTTIGGTSGTSNIQTPLYVSPAYSPPVTSPDGFEFEPGAPYSPPDVNWLDGSGYGGGGVAFNPTAINDINNINIEGTAYFSSSDGTGGGGVGLGGALLGVAGGCIANYLTQKAAGFAASGGTAIFGSLTSVRTYDQTTDANLTADGLIQCIVRALARIAIQQITAQTINWINGGFNGEPAFVQDFGKFFTDVADQAAGEFIQGSDLAFLCSPFQLQVRIAIAQSYARRSSGAAQACTLSDVVGNIEGFLEGDFSQGGWPGLISFTTIPSNNPFGAYAEAQVRLVNAQNQAIQLADRKVSIGGFLAQEECTGPLNLQTGKNGPPCRIITPGSTIEASLETALNANIEELQLADSIDAILSALLNSLITNVLQKGLANVSGSDVGGYSNQDSQATAEARALLQALQAAVQLAQQYGSVQQGSIADIQNAQRNLTNLQNCWISHSNSANAQAAENQIDTLETRIPGLNNNVTRANAAIAQVAQIQTQALSASDINGVRAAAGALAQAEVSGALITTVDVTLAQQNRTTLQSEMFVINQQTSLELNQCYAS